MLLIAVLITITAAGLSLSSATLLSFTQNRNSGRKPLEEGEFMEVLQSIKEQREFDSILILRRQAADCFVPLCNLYPEVPKIVVSPAENLAFKHSFNSELLAIVCMKYAFDEEILESLAKNLLHMRQTRVIFLLKDFSNVTAITRSIFEFSLEQNMINVLSFFEDYQETNVFHRLIPFPELQLQELVVKSVGSTEPFFPRHWRNMYGKSVLTLPDQIEPHSFVYVDRMGRQKLSGYVTKLIMLFANKYNATLRYLHKLHSNDSVHPSEIRHFILNNTLDLTISITVAGWKDDFLSLSYPFELVKWIIMVPSADELPTSDIYLVIMGHGILPLVLLLVICFTALHASISYTKERPVNLPKLIINDEVIRGILGQPFTWHRPPRFLLKLLYFLMFLAGIILSTIYGAQLNTLLTSHPTQKEIASVDDMRARQIKLLIPDTEVRRLRTMADPRVLEDLASTSQIIPYREAFARRRSLDTTHAYTVTTSLWPNVNLQQEFYSRRLFQAPKTLTLVDMLMFTIPLQLNSIYKEPLEALIHRVHDAGLIRYWHRRTFFDMVEAGIISLKDPIKGNTVESITVEDLQWVWLMLLVGWMLAVSSCFGEILMGRYDADYERPQQQRRRNRRCNNLFKLF